MPTWKHIDTAGLPKGYDCADLIAEGKTRDQIIAWLGARITPGPPPSHVEPVKAKQKPKLQPLDAPPPKAAYQTPLEPESNVQALRKPDADEDFGFPPEFSEDALADRFSEKFSQTLSYCGAWKSWQVWDGKRWSSDDTLVSVDCARKLAREANMELLQRTDLGDKRVKMANQIATHRSMAAIINIARSDRRHTIRPADFDADPWALNTPDGVVNLITGQLRPARREDFCRKMTKVGPNNKKPSVWLNYLDYATNGDQELQRYLQRVAGYCLTGSIAEHAFFFLYGDGGTGKGTYKDMLDWLLQDYAVAANMDTFTEQRFSKHSSELAYFHGARLVTAPETDEGSRWAEGRIKSMTGGDPITASFKHQNEFTYLPLFKLIFAGNHKPELRSVDNSIRRRLYLIPFEHVVTEDRKDLALPEKLRQPDEAGAILNWMIEGCLDWRENRLQPPKAVRSSTSDYLDEEDRIGRFLNEHVDFIPTLRMKTSLLYMKYTTWAGLQNEFVLPRNRFLKLIKQKGLKSEKFGGEQIILGIGQKQ